MEFNIGRFKDEMATLISWLSNAHNFKRIEEKTAGTTKGNLQVQTKIHKQPPFVTILFIAKWDDF